MVLIRIVSGEPLVRIVRENTVALQGTLDTFALPDVLRLLATTKKSGQLQVQGRQGDGSLDLIDGAVTGGVTSLAATDGPEDVLFELLRLDDGSFLFDQDAAVDDAGNAAEVENVIAAAESAHTEWQELSAVVPSLDVAISLVDELLPSDTVIDRDRWRLIVGIGSGTTVRRLGERLSLRELPVLRATRSLVDDGLATIGEEGGAVTDVDLDTAGPMTEVPVADLPSLDDETDAGDLFEGSGVASGELPEPLLGGSVGADGSSGLLPDEAALLEAQLDGLAPEHRDLVERAADSGDPDAAEQLLDELPEGAIDRELMRRFLGSVRS